MQMKFCPQCGQPLILREVGDLFWADTAEARRIVARENNLSGAVLDACAALLSSQS